MGGFLQSICVGVRVRPFIKVLWELVAVSPQLCGEQRHSISRNVSIVDTS